MKTGIASCAILDLTFREVVLGAFERDPRLEKREMPAGNGRIQSWMGIDIADCR